MQAVLLFSSILSTSISLEYYYCKTISLSILAPSAPPLVVSRTSPVVSPAYIMITILLMVGSKANYFSRDISGGLGSKIGSKGKILILIRISTPN